MLLLWYRMALIRFNSICFTQRIYQSHYVFVKLFKRHRQEFKYSRSLNYRCKNCVKKFIAEKEKQFFEKSRQIINGKKIQFYKDLINVRYKSFVRYDIFELPMKEVNFYKYGVLSEISRESLKLEYRPRDNTKRFAELFRNFGIFQHA